MPSKVLSIETTETVVWLVQLEKHPNVGGPLGGKTTKQKAPKHILLEKRKEKMETMERTEEAGG